MYISLVATKDSPELKIYKHLRLSLSFFNLSSKSTTIYVFISYTVVRCGGHLVYQSLLSKRQFI